MASKAPEDLRARDRLSPLSLPFKDRDHLRSSHLADLKIHHLQAAKAEPTSKVATGTTIHLVNQDEAIPQPTKDPINSSEESQVINEIK